MTKGLDAGPFGSPTRYALTKDQKPEGRKDNDWNRTINIFRCFYSFIGQVRDTLPESLAAVAWLGYDQPITTCYVPVYAGTQKVPDTYMNADPKKFDTNSTWWAFNFIANWVDLRFNAMIEDIRAEQKRLEGKFFAEQADFEKKAAELYKKDPKKASEMITKHVGDYMTQLDKDWWALAWNLVGKYNDGYRITSDTLEPLGYPTDWLKAVGFGDQDAEPKK